MPSGRINAKQIRIRHLTAAFKVRCPTVSAMPLKEKKVLKST